MPAFQDPILLNHCSADCAQTGSIKGVPAALATEVYRGRKLILSLPNPQQLDRLRGMLEDYNTRKGTEGVEINVFIDEADELAKRVDTHLINKLSPDIQRHVQQFWITASVANCFKLVSVVQHVWYVPNQIKAAHAARVLVKQASQHQMKLCHRPCQ